MRKVLLIWDDKGCVGSSVRPSRGLEVTGGGTGVVSHAGLALLRELADRSGLTAGLSGRRRRR
jgi:hypothetical protein